jgi:hypothetical protein
MNFTQPAWIPSPSYAQPVQPQPQPTYVQPVQRITPSPIQPAYVQPLQPFYSRPPVYQPTYSAQPKYPNLPFLPNMSPPKSPFATRQVGPYNAPYPQPSYYPNSNQSPVSLVLSIP